MVVKIRNKIVKIIEPSVYEITDEEGKFIVNMKERTCSCGCNDCKHVAFVIENKTSIAWEEKIWEAMREFEEWRKKVLIEKLRSFKPLDEKTRRAFQAAGWEYDEELSRIVYVLMS